MPDFPARLSLLLILCLLAASLPKATPAPALSRPLFLAVEADGAVVVSDEGLPGVLRIRAGVVELVSGATRGRGPGFLAPAGIAVSPDGSLAVVDGDLPGLLRVDPASGDRRVLSGPGRGAGPAFLEPVGIAVHAGRFYVTDAGRGAVLVIDPQSGDRSELASRARGTPFSEPGGIGVTAGGQVVVADPGISTLFVIEARSGRARVAASPATRPAARLGELRGVAVLDEERVAVSDNISDQVYEIRLSDGRVTPLGARISRPEGLAVLPDGGLLAAAPDGGSVLRLGRDGVPVPLVRGARPSDGREPRGLALLPDGDFVLVDRTERSVSRVTALGRRRIADGRASSWLQGPHSVEVHPASGILVTDENTASVLAIGEDGSVRTVSRAGERGDGPPLVFPNGLAVESAASLLVADEGLPGVVRVRLADGGREVVSAAGRGAGPALDSPTGIDVEADGGIVVAEDMLGALLRVDPRSGDRSVLSRAGVRGRGPAFAVPFAVAVQADGVLLVVDDGRDALFRVDPGSGDRRLVSGLGRGAGPPFRSPIDVVVVSPTRAAVLDAGLDAIVGVDLRSGDRVVVPLGAP